MSSGGLPAILADLLLPSFVFTVIIRSDTMSALLAKADIGRIVGKLFRGFGNSQKFCEGGPQHGGQYMRTQRQCDSTLLAG
jgi:hypothetical protein